MPILAVDLAAKYSAACLMDETYQVLKQFDSWGVDEDDFLSLITDTWIEQGLDGQRPEVLIVEDLPHGLKYSTLIKTVCRLQGRLVQAMYESCYGRIEDIVFVAPIAWRLHYAGLERGTGPSAVVPVAETLGYLPPADLIERAKGNGGKGRADKVATDYCSAYLIARWAIDMKKEYGTYDVPGTSRYDTDVIRKKDFNAQDC